jgi:hypothetical protein
VKEKERVKKQPVRARKRAKPKERELDEEKGKARDEGESRGRSRRRRAWTKARVKERCVGARRTVPKEEKNVCEKARRRVRRRESVREKEPYECEGKGEGGNDVYESEGGSVAESDTKGECEGERRARAK